MRPRLLILSCLLFLAAVATAQPIGWTCLRNAAGDTLKPVYSVPDLLQGRDGDIYFPASLANTGTSHVFRWNDTNWHIVDSTTPTALGSQLNGPICQDKNGRMYAVTGDGGGRWYVAMWNDTAWSVIEGTGADTLGAFYIIYDLCTDTAGNVYAATMSATPNSKPFVSRWDGTGWTKISAGPVLNESVKKLCADNQGNIYAAGILTLALNDFFVAKWDGTVWTPVGGTGTAGLHANGAATAIWCDAQDNLYAGGAFTNTAGEHYVAKWNGTTWSEVGTGAGALKAHGDIEAIYTDVQQQVYAAGRFRNDSSRMYVARYDGTSWSELGAGPYPLAISASQSVAISAIAGDSKGNIYAGGVFYAQNGNGLNGIARYGLAPKLSVQPLSPAAHQLSVYPNPTGGQLTISATTGMAGTPWYLYDIRGTLSRSGTLQSADTHINIADLPPGTYLLQAGTASRYAVRVKKM